MAWFSVSVFFREVRADPPSLWHERIYLREADSETALRSAVEADARDAGHEFETVDGAHVRWVFHAIAQVQLLDDAPTSSGVEIFSRFLRQDEALGLLTPFEE